MPHREPVFHAMPGRRAAAHALKAMSADPRDLSGIPHARMKLITIGITIESLTVMEGVSADNARPIINHPRQMVRYPGRSVCKTKYAMRVPSPVFRIANPKNKEGIRIHIAEPVYALVITASGNLAIRHPTRKTTHPAK
jgi:hypothetical protein